MSFRVLVAEDENMIRRGIICSLDWVKLGCGPVDGACNGREALERIQSGLYDIVLMDINMPLMSGLDVLEQTYQEYGYVAVLITGYSDFAYAKRAMHYGVLDYLLKPVDIDELYRTVEHACAERARRLDYSRLREERQQRLGEIKVLLPERTDAGSETVNRMIAYIEAHYGEKITLPMLSQQLFYSESFMTRRFKSETGMNFADYLSRYRIQRALAMMQLPNVRLSDVAAACGFGDYKYFNQVFKKYMGCSAKDYLREARGEA